MISELDSRGLPIPLELQNYRLKSFAGRVPPPVLSPGPNKLDGAYRDLFLAMLVEYVRRHHGLEPYGRGFAVVADALAAIGRARSTDAVRTAWKRWGKLVAERGLNLDIFERPTT